MLFYALPRLLLLGIPSTVIWTKLAMVVVSYAYPDCSSSFAAALAPNYPWDMPVIVDLIKDEDDEQ
jgi:hypothetical protein